MKLYFSQLYSPDSLLVRIMKYLQSHFSNTYENISNLTLPYDRMSFFQKVSRNTSISKQINYKDKIPFKIKYLPEESHSILILCGLIYNGKNVLFL